MSTLDQTTKTNFFKRTIQTWRNVLFSSSLDTLQNEKTKSNLGIALLWMVIVGVISMPIKTSIVLLTTLFSLYSPDSEMRMFHYSIVMLFSLRVVGFVIIMAPISLLILSLVYYISVKSEKRKGTFEEQTYLVAAILAPFYLFFQTIGAIPFIGWPISFVVLIYLVKPTARTIEVVHGLSFEEAKKITQVPIAVIIILYSAFYIRTLTGFAIDGWRGYLGRW